ncbi:alpha/beta fold hydrolase [Natronorarus salvus]|uniref:alpha/beta fold hydrolase n=1 Tax=Natronorarus salvus TaxID=3117733 RepID=UPI002F263AF5
MRRATNDGVEIEYAVDGEGETVVSIPDLGYGPWACAWQHAAFAGPFESVVLAPRGTAHSDAPPGPYSVPDLAADVEAVLADLGAPRAHLVGTGLGGTVALSHALTYSRARSLALIGASPGGPLARLPDEPRAAMYAPRDDPEALRESLSPVLSERFRAEVLDVVEWRAGEDADREGWEAQEAALLEFDASDRLHEMTVPALVIHGTEDRVVPVENGRLLAETLPRGEFVGIDGGPHLVGIERSRAVNDELVNFLNESSSD